MDAKVKIGFGTNILAVLIGAGVLLILSLFFGIKLPGTAGSHDTLVIEKHFTYDSSKVILQPLIYRKTDSIFIGVREKVDTSAIIKDYFTKNTFKYVFRDSSIEAELSDTVLKNTSLGMGMSYKILRPTSVGYNVTPTQLRNKVFIGAFAGYIDKIYGGVSITFENKKERLLQFGYNPFRKEYYAGYSIKISLK